MEKWADRYSFFKSDEDENVYERPGNTEYSDMFGDWCAVDLKAIVTEQMTNKGDWKSFIMAGHAE